MAQHDLEILTSDANTGQTFRNQINAALKALASLQKGGSAPSFAFTEGCEFWADTNNMLLKMRKADASGYITIGKLDENFLSLLSLYSAQNITAQHTFSPAIQQSPFLLGTNAQGQKVTGLNADQLDGVEASELSIRDVTRDLIIKNNAIYPNYQIDINAEEAIVQDASGNSRRIAPLDLTVDITTSGANGLDTGAEAISTWYHIWVIYDSSTQTKAGLFSISPTSPTMPSGYTYKAYVGAIYNNASSNFRVIYQKDNYVSSELVAVLSSGSATTYTSVNLSTIVPSTAKIVQFVVYISDDVGPSSWCYLTPSSTGAYNEQRIGSAALGSTGAYLRVTINVPMTTAQTIYYRVTEAEDDLDLDVIGWRY